MFPMWFISKIIKNIVFITNLYHMNHNKLNADLSHFTFHYKILLFSLRFALRKRKQNAKWQNWFEQIAIHQN